MPVFARSRQPPSLLRLVAGLGQRAWFTAASERRFIPRSLIDEDHDGDDDVHHHRGATGDHAGIGGTSGLRS
eukprot:6172974-Pleurochrysis_carterae.AAC.3